MIDSRAQSEHRSAQYDLAQTSSVTLAVSPFQDREWRLFTVAPSRLVGTNGRFHTRNVCVIPQSRVRLRLVVRSGHESNT